jgi:hypothetical protein
MSKLGNEDYVAFLDESGEFGKSDLQVVSGVLIPARWLRSAERRWMDFIRDSLGSSSGKVEVKSRELLRGENASLHAQKALLEKGWPALSAKAAGRLFYRDALEHIATIEEIRVLTVGLPTRHPAEAYRLWFWMMYALLVERPKSPRPRLPLTVIDGEDTSFRRAHELVAHRFYRSFPHCQPYVTRGKGWFIGGSVLQESQLHPFVQMADLVAGAARHAMTKRKGTKGWYDKHLVAHAHTQRKTTIEVSGHALSQLKARSRNDACGSGWKDAQVLR